MIEKSSKQKYLRSFADQNDTFTPEDNVSYINSGTVLSKREREPVQAKDSIMSAGVNTPFDHVVDKPFSSLASKGKNPKKFGKPKKSMPPMVNLSTESRIGYSQSLATSGPSKPAPVTQLKNRNASIDASSLQKIYDHKDLMEKKYGDPVRQMSPINHINKYKAKFKANRSKQANEAFSDQSLGNMIDQDGEERPSVEDSNIN